jgi:hypothetical protein
LLEFRIVSGLLSKNVKIIIYKIVILSGLYGSVVWSLILRESEKKVLKRNSGTKEDEGQVE